jgi:hypothetical protein
VDSDWCDDLFDRVSEKYNTAFVNNIPMESLKELPENYM